MKIRLLKRKKSAVALLMCMMMLLSVITTGGYSPRAEDPAPEDFLEIVTKYTASPSSGINVNASIDAQLSLKMFFSLPMDTATWKLEEHYVYDFDLKSIPVINKAVVDDPGINALLAKDITDAIIMGGERVGTYTIHDSVVTLNFYEGLTKLTAEGAERNGEFQFECGLEADKIADEGGEYILKFTTKEGVQNPEVKVNPKDVINADITVNKSNATFDKDNMTATYTIVIENNGTQPLSDVRITDYMGNKLTLKENALGVFDVVSNGATVVTTKDSGSKYYFDIASLPVGTTTITYVCDVDGSAIPEANNSSSEGNTNGLDNTISGRVNKDGHDYNIYLDDNKNQTQTTKFGISKDLVTKDVSVTDHEITWTIVINSGSTEFDLFGYKFKDILDIRLTRPAVSDITITASGNTNETVDNANIEELKTAIANGTEYEFPADSTAEYTITYTTTAPTVAGKNKYNNTAIVTNNTYTDTATKDTPEIGDKISDKTYSGLEGKDKSDKLPDQNNDGEPDFSTVGGEKVLVLPWSSEVIIPSGATSFTYYDYVEDSYWENGKGYDQTSLIVKAVFDNGTEQNLVSGSDYTTTYTQSGNKYEMTIVFASSVMNQINNDGKTKVVLSYSTYGTWEGRAVDDWRSYKNHYDVTVDSIHETGEASVYKKYSESTSTGSINKEVASYDETTHTITWKVVIKDATAPMNDFVLYDVVSDMEYYGYKLDGYSYVGASSDMRAIVRYGKDYSVYEVKIEADDSAIVPSNKKAYKIVFNQDANRLSTYGTWQKKPGTDNPDGKDIEIYYTTRVMGDYLLYNNTTVFSNEVEGKCKDATDNTISVGKASNSKELTTTVLNKKLETGDGQKTPTLTYSIEINPDGEQLSPGGKYYKVEDSLPDNLVYVPGKTVISDKDGNEYTYVADESLVINNTGSDKIYYLSFKDNKLTFTVPDQVALVIKYNTTMLTDSTISADSYVNTALIAEPYAKKNSSSSSDEQRHVVYSKATVYTSLFTVEKLDSADITKRLGGAKFELQEYGYVSGAWETTPSKTYTAVTVEGRILQSKDFDDGSGFHPVNNKIYVLREIVAPLGYELSSKEYKFIVLSSDDSVSLTEWSNRLYGMNDVYRIMGDTNFVFTNDKDNSFIPNSLKINKKYYKADGITPADSLPSPVADIEIYSGNISIADCASNIPLSKGVDLGNGFKITETTTGSHVIDMVCIPDGDYTVYEKTAPTGYNLLDTVYHFKVTDGKIKWESDNAAYDVTAEIANTQIIENSLTINKLYYKPDGTTAIAALPEKAVFTYQKSNSSWTAIGTKTIINSEEGEGYVYKLKNLPEGYYLIDEADSSVYVKDSRLPLHVTVSGIGTITIEDNNGNVLSPGLNLYSKAVDIDNKVNENKLVVYKEYYEANGDLSVAFNDATNQTHVVFTLEKENGGSFVPVTPGDYTATTKPEASTAINTGEYTWDNLEPGTYRIKESLATGDTTSYETLYSNTFVVDSSYQIKVSGSTARYNAEITVTNRKLADNACRFYLTKQISDQNGNLSSADNSSGITFKLSKHDGSVYREVVTGSDVLTFNVTKKRWESTGLSDGKYKLEETATKSGYIPASYIEFVIDSSKIEETSIKYGGTAITNSDYVSYSYDEQTLVFNLINYPNENEIEITKEYKQPDGTSDIATPSAYATFSLYKVGSPDDVLVKTITGDATKIYNFNKLEPGDYKIVESAPAGYSGCTDILFTVKPDYSIDITSTDSNIVTNNSREAKVTVKNTISNKIELTKYFRLINGSIVAVGDSDYSTLIAGTTFILKDSSDIDITSTNLVKDDATGKITISNLNDGTYTLTESPATGYASGTITLTVTNGKIAASYSGAYSIDFTGVSGNGSTDVKANLYNRQKSNSLALTKQYVDAAGNPIDLSNVLTKANFTLSDGSSNYSYTYNSATGVYTFKNLPAGSYTLTEQALEGFEIAPTISFTVDIYGQIRFSASSFLITNIPGWTVLDEADMHNVKIEAVNKKRHNEIDLSKFYYDIDGVITGVPSFMTSTDWNNQFYLEAVGGVKYYFVPNSTGTVFKIENIPSGTYALKENVPSGYTMANGTIKVIVNPAGVVTASYTGVAGECFISGTNSYENTNILLNNYEISNEISINKQYVTATGEDISIDDLDSTEYAQFKLYKVISASTRYEITDAKCVKVKPDEGSYKFVNLEEGNYEIEEIAGAGFETTSGKLSFHVDSQRAITGISSTISGVTISGDDHYKQAGITNKRKTFDNHFEFKKLFINQGNEEVTGSDYDSLLGGVAFTMKDSKGSNVALSYAAGVWSVERLEPGIYYVYETACPTGYVPIAAPTAPAIKLTVTKEAPEQTKFNVEFMGANSDDFVADAANTDMNVKISVKNHQEVDNKLSIDKKFLDIYGNVITDAALRAVYLGNTTFTIASENGMFTAPIPYDSSEKAYVYEDLQTGTYFISESADTNYTALSDIKVVVASNGEITVSYNGEAGDVQATYGATRADVTISALNYRKTTYVNIGKKDITNREELPGAWLEIRDKQSDVVVVDKWQSTASTHRINISTFTPGVEYILREITAPYGYEIAEDIIFTVDALGNVYVNGSTTPLNDNTFYMEDERKYVDFSKKDLANGKELPGATIIIKDINGNEIDRWVSTDTKHSIAMKEFLPYMEYTLTEITAPYGYELAESIVFKLDKAGKVYVRTKDEFKAVDDNTVVMEDDYKYLYITKVDITNSKELPGAKLTITDKNGNVIAQWTSSEESYRIPVLSFKYDEEYTLTEVTAPDGYEVAESIVFKFDKENNFYIRNSSNVFTKVDKTTMTMQDAPIEITTITPDDNPKTGDNSPIRYIFLVMLISLVALIRMFISRKIRMIEK